MAILAIAGAIAASYAAGFTIVVILDIFQK